MAEILFTKFIGQLPKIMVITMFLNKFIDLKINLLFAVISMILVTFYNQLKKIDIPVKYISFRLMKFFTKYQINSPILFLSLGDILWFIALNLFLGLGINPLLLITTSLISGFVTRQSKIS